MGIFKAYDVRGVYPSEIDEEKVYKIGRAFADMLKEELKKENITIIIGRDARVSSPSLSKKIIEGVIAQGVNVVDIGLISTPSFYFAVGKHNADGGLQISASHNPKEYNGVKIVKAKAYPVGEDTGIKEIEKRVNENKFEESETKGSVSQKEGIVKEDTEFSLKFADISKIKPFKIVVDTGNGMGAQYIEELFKHLNCELIKMYFDIDGTFPNHTADPMEPKNTEDLRKKVVEEKADLGIAIDGDGDRIFFIDNEGGYIPPAITRAILSKIFLRENPGAIICYDIRPGKITYDVIVENGGTPELTKVGHSLIKEHAIKVGAPFAGESSGHFFVKTENGFFETPMIVTLKLLEEISNEGKPFTEILKPLRKYFHSGEINLEVKDKAGIIEKVKDKYSNGKLNEIDGIYIEYDDFWFNVRASNTQPLLRFTLEAKTKKIMGEKRDEILDFIKSHS